MTLYKKDSNGKIRVAQLFIIDTDRGSVIQRVTGIDGMKETWHPEIYITDGKAGRNIKEQAELQGNAIIQKWLNQGYKHTLEEVQDVKTDTYGLIKPMLALAYEDSMRDLFHPESRWYCSPKLDGVRALVGLVDGEVQVVSRGGKIFGKSVEHIRTEKGLMSFFEKYPDTILDGELYLHGMALQDISGMVRKDAKSEVQYHIYDYYSKETPDNSCHERVDFMYTNIHSHLDGTHMHLVDHWMAHSLDEIMEFHDEFVKRGYEGCVARNIDSVYGAGARDKRMIKFKKYQDAEFEIVGYEKGLRIEDFVFTCKIGNKTFEAKPAGTREQRIRYFNDIEKTIGKMATVKYFNLSKEGIPTQPILMDIRDYE